MHTATSNSFYDALPREPAFAALTDAARYHTVPDDWFVGVSDIVGSTELIAAGRYKTVNMVGAAIISAVMNANGKQAFPFVFGGDGAGFAIPPDLATSSRDAMAAVATWAWSEFRIEMRVAMLPVSALRTAGVNLEVARFQVSQGADYAMFAGGGLHWAEQQMKQGRFLLPKAAVGTVPDLTGLSCRWSHMQAQHGIILSLVIVAEPDAAPSEVAAVLNEVIAISDGLERSGHPAPFAGMQARWPPAGATLEAHAARAGASLSKARAKAIFEAFVAWVLIRTGIKVGGFDARRYASVVASNADFRKLDDGLKMTLDCSVKTRDQMQGILQRAADRGIVRYGMATQDAAMMTCIVPSILTDDHLHFIDGASGGYTKAASMMKSG